MRLRLFALALPGLALLSAGSAEAQTTWARSYGGSLVDRANAVDLVPAGGYIVTGSFGSGFGDLWVLRLDAQGSVVWQKTYGGAQPDEAFAVKSTADGGFVVAGVTHSFGAGGGDAWVLKLDAQGNVVAQTTFGGSSLDEARSLAVVSDGYVLAGTTSSFGAGGSDAWVFKLDGQLDVVWSKTFGDALAGMGTSIIATADGGMLFSGAGQDTFGNYTALLKLDGAGTPVWSKSQGATFGASAVTVAGGGYLALVPLGPGFMVTKFDDSGTPVWSWAHTGHGPLSAMAVLADGGFVLTGGTRLLRLDSNGGRLWSRTYGANGVAGNEIVHSVVPTPDGGYVLAGDTRNFGAGDVDAWVIKVNSDGLIEAGCPHAFTGTGISQIGNTAASTPPWPASTAAATAADSSASAATPSVLELGQCQSLIPASLTVDATASGGSNLNRVFEPGEACVVEPGWNNQNSFAVSTLTGTIPAFTGPAGAVYSVDDNAANYGSLASGATTNCSATTSNCYVLRVSNPSSRPALHWDAAFIEDLSTGERRIRSLHVGGSFSDVATSNAFYGFIETLLHHGVTGGCTGAQYCPTTPTTRGQMAVFVLVSKEGAGFAPPACTAGSEAFADVPASNPFCSWIEELSRRGVVAGCGGPNYCPTSAVLRDQMAVFVLRTLDPSLSPPACVSGGEAFPDVLASSLFCPWVEELARRGVVTGCGGGNYCPKAAVTRAQMGVFLSLTFGLTLYGP